MTCPSALARSRFADGELAPAEAEDLEAHLESCVECRRRVQELEEETRVLRSALAAPALTMVPPFQPASAAARLLSWLGGGAVAVWIVNAAWTALASTVADAHWLDWLTPDALGLGIDLTVGLLLQLASDGSTGLTDLLHSVGWLVLGVGAVTIFWQLLRRHSRDTLALCLQACLVIGLGALASPGHAFELRRDEDRVTVPAGETIDDTLVVLADDVLIEGDVSGDLIALGERVVITGRVGGLLLAAAESISIEGAVAASVVVAGETVDVRGTPLQGNLYAAAETVTVHADVAVAGNAAVAASELKLRGSVGRELMVAGETVTVSGAVARNLKAYAGALELADGARVGGDLIARLRSEDALVVADGALVTGETLLEPLPEPRNRYLTPGFYLGEALQFVAAFLVGLALFFVFPGLAAPRLDDGSELLSVLGLGVLALIATPAVAVVAIFTLIGAPLGILALLLWLTGLYLALLVVALQLGNRLIPPDGEQRALPLVVGLAILFVLVNVPLLGGIVRALATVVGLGLIVQWLRGRWSARGGV